MAFIVHRPGASSTKKELLEGSLNRPVVLSQARVAELAAEPAALETFVKTSGDSLKTTLARLFPLLYRPPPAVREALRNALAPRNSLYVRAEAALLLLDTNHDPALIPIFGEMLSSNHYAKEQAATALASYGRDAVPALMKVFDSKAVGKPSGENARRDGSSARLAAESLAQIGDDALPPLVMALREKKGTPQLWAVYAVGRFGPGALGVRATLLDFLKVKDYQKARDYPTFFVVIESLAEIDPWKEDFPYLLPTPLRQYPPSLGPSGPKTARAIRGSSSSRGRRWRGSKPRAYRRPCASA